MFGHAHCYRNRCCVYFSPAWGWNTNYA